MLTREKKIKIRYSICLDGRARLNDKSKEVHGVGCTGLTTALFLTWQFSDSSERLEQFLR